MKILKKTLLTISAAMLLLTAVGCKKDKISSSSVKDPNIGANEIKVEMSQEADANDTVFSLNSVIDAGAQTENGEHYIYLDVTIKNSSDTAYSLSTLNNFYLIMPDKSEVYGHIRTQLYALNNFSDKYFGSPFDVPANGEFRGIIGGFVLPEGQNTFTVGFFPTKEVDTDKYNVIKIDVDASKIVPISGDLLKQ